tara:strand:- start:334 stop:732 length:399 start_codon:yes stop_codon:yes gene_type:complete
LSVINFSFFLKKIPKSGKVIGRDHDLKYRIKLVASERRENIAQLAKKLELNPKSLQVVLSDPKKLVSLNIIKSFINIEVNLTWLISGKGEMFQSEINTKNTKEKILDLNNQIQRQDDLIDSLERILGNRNLN